jgi:hypothetical protein
VNQITNSGTSVGKNISPNGATKHTEIADLLCRQIETELAGALGKTSLKLRRVVAGER